MPVKSIYVSESDRDLLEEARRLYGGNLSGLIIDAVRDYVTHGVGDQTPASDVHILLGDAVTRIVAFHGRRLVFVPDVAEQQCAIVYRTNQSRYAFITCNVDFSAADTELTRQAVWTRLLASWLDHTFTDSLASYRLRICASFTDLPPFLQDQITSRSDSLRSGVERLDI